MPAVELDHKREDLEARSREVLPYIESQTLIKHTAANQSLDSDRAFRTSCTHSLVVPKIHLESPSQHLQRPEPKHHRFHAQKTKQTLAASASDEVNETFVLVAVVDHCQRVH